MMLDEKIERILRDAKSGRFIFIGVQHCRLQLSRQCIIDWLVNESVESSARCRAYMRTCSISRTAL